MDMLNPHCGIDRDSRGVVRLTICNAGKLNIVSSAVTNGVREGFEHLAADHSIRAVILAGESERSMIGGADIKEMADQAYADMYRGNFFARAHDRVAGFRKPIIAAVSGYALGGGCELAMLCDFIIASDTAKFGQPEINLGVAPGIGGSQRLTRAVGKAKAMDMCLTGRMMDAAEAERAGLVSRVVASDALLDEARAAAAKIAGQSILAVMANKELVNAAFETTLAQGVVFERRLFHSLFAFDDQKEGMAAFVEKRKPAFTGR